MPTRFYVALLASLPVNAVLFGAAAIAILSIPALSAHAPRLIPNAVLASVLLTPPIAWIVAGRMMLRYWPKPERKPVPAPWRR